MRKAIHRKLGVCLLVLGLISLTSACTKEQQEGIDHWCRLGTEVHGDYEACKRKAKEIYNECATNVECAYEGAKEFCRTAASPGACYDWWKDKIKELYQNSISPNIPSNCAPQKNSLNAAISSGSDASAVSAGQALVNCVAAGGTGGNGDCGSGSYKRGGGLGWCQRPTAPQSFDTGAAPVGLESAE